MPSRQNQCYPIPLGNAIAYNEGMADPATVGIVTSLIGKVVDKVGDYFPTPEEKLRAKAELMAMVQEQELKELDTRMKAIVAEAQSGSWIASNWRPLTMLTFVFIIANNYIFYPYLSLFWSDAPTLELAPEMFELLKLGIGGYVVGRSVEKSVKAYKS